METYYLIDYENVHEDGLKGIQGSGDNVIFRTQGDFNNTEDEDPVPAGKLVGVWTGTNLRGLGNVAMFLQSTPGLILCIGVPIVILVAYELKKAQKAGTEEKAAVDNTNSDLSASARQAQSAAGQVQEAAMSEADKAKARAEELQAQLEALQAQLKAQQAKATGAEASTSADADGQSS